MTWSGRVAALLVCLAGIFLAVAALVRQAASAADGAAVWSPTRSWASAVAEPSWATTGVAAAVCAAAGVTLIALAVRQLRVGRRGPLVIEFGAEGGSVRLDVAALERALRHRLEKELPGVRARDLSLEKAENGWRIRVEAEVPARDLTGLRKAAATVLSSDLERIGDLRLAGADMVVTGLVPRIEETA
jgi:hypothetical protein